MDPSRELLRHTLATLAYRGAKTLRGASEAFAAFRASDTGPTPLRILSHLGDLLEWSLTLVQGQQAWRNSTPQDWGQEVARFHGALGRLDAYLASGAPLASPMERLFQGPIADALTHVGQLAMLRRMAGEPIRGENYFVAEIVAGRVAPEQAAPVREFS